MGDCVMRTRDLTRGSAWEVWTGRNWATAHTTEHCAVVGSAGTDLKTLSYNTCAFHETTQLLLLLGLTGLLNWN